MSKYPISTHTFMMPIRWDYIPKGYTKEKGKQDYDFEDRTPISKMNELMRTTEWKRKFYTIDNDVKRYNEMTYFHSYATSTLFDLQQPSEKNESIIDDNKVMVFYEIPIEENDGSYYKITTINKSYELKLCDVNIHIYDTGVAILVLGCENHSNKSKEDILMINEYGRRIYPQFLSDSTFRLTESTQYAFLSTSLELYNPNINNGIPVYEDFSEYETLANKEVHRIENGNYSFNKITDFPTIIKQLFNENFAFSANDEAPNRIRFSILGDDRMFFQSWYGSNELARIFKSRGKSKPSQYGYEKNPYWYALMNGDKKGGIGDITMQNEELLEKDIKKSTYARWANYGSIFGFTRDSFVAISDDVATLLSNFAPNISVHITSIYYQMAVLSLAQRASILRFSHEIAKLGDLSKTDEKKAVKSIENLYLSYIEFINKIYFREVSPAIQGIEIYEEFQKAMRIENDANSLKEEIQELYNFAELKKQDKLTEVATFFLPFSLVFGILGANFLDINSFTYSPWVWVCIGLVVSYIVYNITMNIQKIKSKIK